jgi:hypothetical protein
MHNTEGPVSGVNPGSVGGLGQTGLTVTLARRKTVETGRSRNRKIPPG